MQKFGLQGKFPQKNEIWFLILLRKFNIYYKWLKYSTQNMQWEHTFKEREGILLDH